MIKGIGCDVVLHSRIAKLWQRFGARFAEKILAPTELSQFKQSHQPIAFLAKRFAAKEAFAKALGTGFRQGLSLKHIAVVNNALGAPHFELYDFAKDLIETRQIHACHLSLSDERTLSMAFVVFD